VETSVGGNLCGWKPLWMETSVEVFQLLVSCVVLGNFLTLLQPLFLHL
jgi:hypothetical protein